MITYLDAYVYISNLGEDFGLGGGKPLFLEFRLATPLAPKHMNGPIGADDRIPSRGASCCHQQNTHSCCKTNTHTNTHFQQLWFHTRLLGSLNWTCFSADSKCLLTDLTVIRGPQLSHSCSQGASTSEHHHFFQSNSSVGGVAMFMGKVPSRARIV